MTTSINFYTTKKTPSNQLLIKLLEKILSDSQTATIAIKDKKTAEEYDKFLWEFDENSFIPHCFDTDEKHKELPILISQDFSKNPSDSDILIFIGKNLPEKEEDINTLKNFKKVIFITNGNDREELVLSEEFRNKHLNNSDFDISIHKQNEAGKWS